MRFDFCRLPPLALLLLLVSVLVVSPNQATANEEEEESYQLQQMRQLSKSQAPSVGVSDGAAEGDLMADADLGELSTNEPYLSDISKVKPEIEKPKLQVLKPSL